MKHRLAGGAGDAKIAMGQVDQVVPELDRQRLVETQLMANLVVSRLTGMVADDLQHARSTGDSAESAKVTSSSPNSVSSRVNSPCSRRVK